VQRSAQESSTVMWKACENCELVEKFVSAVKTEPILGRGLWLPDIGKQ
jgi:hypothetical protein